MQKNILIRLLPSEASDENTVKKYIASAESVSVSDITGYHILKKSIDARSKQVWINFSLQVFINEPFRKKEFLPFYFPEVNNSNKTVIIIGAGPAGLFSALKLIEKGIKPVILERGKDVKSRRRDLAALNKEGVVNPESNYCFGEGGAGTYSDGKLYTRSTKRGDINRILNLFVRFGASENILFESHPHIGTNKLPQIITEIRKLILDCGGEFYFEKKVVDFKIEKDKIKEIRTEDGSKFSGDAIILATGHSARDIFFLLQDKKIDIEFKPFALGVRVEHPQTIIDSSQYHCDTRSPFLPPASYSLVQSLNDRGVFSFCMCPGGIIAPAATSPGEIVVNGWSPSKRNNPYANSGIVVSVEEKDVQLYKNHGPLAGIHFQTEIEKNSFRHGGGKMVAPAQRLIDFCQNKLSSSLPDCSYLPGVNSVFLKDVLPSFVYKSLQYAFRKFGEKMKGYYTNDAIVVATESRTSSPVRIPREPNTLHHPQIKNLYPAGEGAGFAGGIVSAAMDGERLADQIASVLSV